MRAAPSFWRANRSLRASWEPGRRWKKPSRSRRRCARGVPGGRAAFEAGRILVRRWEADPAAADALAEAGIAALSEAVERDPYEPEYAVQFARALWLTGAPIEIRRGVLARAIALRPKDARTYLSLVAHEMRAGDMSAARRVAAEQWLPWCRHGAFRRPETADLLAMARAGRAAPAAGTTAPQALRARASSPAIRTTCAPGSRLLSPGRTRGRGHRELHRRRGARPGKPG